MLILVEIICWSCHFEMRTDYIWILLQDRSLKERESSVILGWEVRGRWWDVFWELQSSSVGLNFLFEFLTCQFTFSPLYISLVFWWLCFEHKCLRNSRQFLLVVSEYKTDQFDLYPNCNTSHRPKHEPLWDFWCWILAWVIHFKKYKN